MTRNDKRTNNNKYSKGPKDAGFDKVDSFNGNKKDTEGYTKKKNWNDPEISEKLTKSTNEIKDTIVNILKESVSEYNKSEEGITEVSYNYDVNDKKQSTGAIAVNIKLSKDGIDLSKAISIITAYDIGSSKFCVNIIEPKFGNVKVIFTAFQKDPKQKLETYLPRIIRSTIDLIK